MKAKPDSVGMDSRLDRRLPSGRAYTGASGNQVDFDVPPDTSLVGIREAFHARCRREPQPTVQAAPEYNLLNRLLCAAAWLSLGLYAWTLSRLVG